MIITIEVTTQELPILLALLEKKEGADTQEALQKALEEEIKAAIEVENGNKKNNCCNCGGDNE